MKAQVQALSLFNQRVDRLDRSALAKRMEDPQYRADYERIMKREWISVDGVTEDAVDAFVLNIRPLIQDQDGFSIRCLAKDVYTLDSVPTDLRDRFNEQRRKWCEHMDSPSLFEHFRKDRKFTNRELFEIPLYGGLAHVNRNKVGPFRALTKQGAYSSLVFVRFLSSLRIFLVIARTIREVNTDLMRHWKC